MEKLSLLPSGTAHGRATEMLASETMASLLEEMASRYRDRILVFDSPPLLATTEARALASHMGQIIMVVEADRTTQVLVEACAGNHRKLPGGHDGAEQGATPRGRQLLRPALLLRHRCVLSPRPTRMHGRRGSGSASGDESKPAARAAHGGSLHRGGLVCMAAAGDALAENWSFSASAGATETYNHYIGAGSAERRIRDVPYRRRSASIAARGRA